MQSRRANVFLTGFMGSGKSTVGRLLAGELSRPFVDTDELVRERTGLDVAALFAERGEGAFRRVEAEVCAEVASMRGRVVALGGGALLDPTTRERVERSGPIVCLLASPETLWRRLAGRANRPLLAEDSGEHDRDRLRALWERRRGHYASFALRIQTDDLPPEAVCEELVLALQPLDISS